MTKQEKRQKNRETRALMMRFLKGSKGLFCVSMLSAALAALCDMLSPQIIRAAIDNAIGGKEADFPAWVMRGVETLGGKWKEVAPGDERKCRFFRVTVEMP